jgi:serine/threonine protein kinase
MSFDPPLDLAEVQAAFSSSYRLLEPIYIGGQGAVFKASALNGEDKLLSPLMALKLYFPEQLSERTEREIQALRRIASPQLVKLVDTSVIA